MKLITKSIENAISKYPLYSQDGKGKDAKVICKFFLQGFTWYVLEGEKRGDDYLFFGIVDGIDREYGYFTLSQLMGARGAFGLGVERDKYFKPATVGELNLN